jgi:Zn-dependent peptidase ImmA (M78 family)
MVGIDSTEARGFSVEQRPLPVVVANNRDPFPARSFTLLHELMHVALHQGGICDLHSSGRIEPFCTGAVLVPSDALLAEEAVIRHGAEPVWADAELLELATLFRVSREVVLRRLLILGQTDEAFYRTKRHELLTEYARREEDDREIHWGPSPSVMAVVRAGPAFTRLVLERYRERAITASDVSVFMGVRLKHIPRIEQFIFGRPGEE